MEVFIILFIFFFLSSFIISLHNSNNGSGDI